jgi:hypothetical protein
MFDPGSGRPGGIVFETSLLARLRNWAAAFAAGSEVPRIVLLVGGPGNGKTEAVEATVDHLGAAFDDQGLIPRLRDAFETSNGIAPRLVKLGLANGGSLSLVQDASATGGGKGSPSLQLVRELDQTLAGGPTDAYLCCVNRGILDDALILSSEEGPEGVRALLEAITAAIGLQPDAPSCWPLGGHPAVAVWPMDAESLLMAPLSSSLAPASALLDAALDGSKWASAGECGAGYRCPFCHSREQLADTGARAALLEGLRFFEVATAKRWSFRDLFSVVSYLLAGHRPVLGARAESPCSWAARLAKLDEQASVGAAPSKDTSTALFHLVAAQYQHSLYHRWDRDAAVSLLRDIRDLGLQHDNAAMGLHWFLLSRRGQYLPAPIAGSLEALVDAMDPALAAPEAEAVLPGGRTLRLRDADVRFSRSVAEGREFVARVATPWAAELELLDRLAGLDKLLSQPAVRRRRPHAASRVQRLARDFGCRLSRRTLGTRCGAVRDRDLLAAFQQIVGDKTGEELHDVAREVENLLNRDRDFEISLTTTFGQPLPPPDRRATLVVPARRVRPFETSDDDGPGSPLPFLRVGDSASSRPLALTYDLFKAVRELERGMSPASLPSTVLALLDTAKARLAGSIVHDASALERARILLGASGLAVEERRRGFMSVERPQP